MRAEDYRIPYRIVLGIIFGNFGEKLPNRNCFGINSVIFLCAMVSFNRAFGKGVSDKAFHVEVPRGAPFEFCK